MCLAPLWLHNAIILFQDKSLKKEKKSKKRKAEEVQDDNSNAKTSVKRKKSDITNDDKKDLSSPEENNAKTVLVNGHTVVIPNRKRTRSVSLSEEHDPIAQKGKFSNFGISDMTVEKLEGTAFYILCICLKFVIKVDNRNL